MILPYISSVTRDVFRMVPSMVKEAAYGVGSTTWEATRAVTLRYSLRGIMGAGFLGLGRALGETMAVTFVIGNNHNISPSLFSSGNTIASTLANEFTEAAEPLYLSALIELGLVLFLITLLFQIIAQLWLWSIKKKLA
jgi:phosphate transport system permease protein